MLKWITRFFCQHHRQGLYYIGGSETLPPPLKGEEEKAALAALERGDEGAKQTLVEHNLRLVVYIARRFENTGINIEDLISIGTIGLIKAINTSAPATEETPYKLEKTQRHPNARKYLTEEILMAGSTAKMAELTAKEIFNIRESKNLILRGQAENMPKDGASLQLVIDNLNQQEQAMTEMFTGINDREDQVFTVRLSPEEGLKDRIAFRFSEKLGILTPDDLAGEPIYVNLTSKTALGTQEEGKGKQPKGVLYNIPGKANVSVSFEGKTVFEEELPVTQLGYTEVLTDGLFDKKVNTRVVFNPNTGAIVKIDKD